jgi:hypothetical protein
MFGTLHILYMMISALVSAVLLVVLYKKIKEQSAKEGILKFFAVVTVIIHYSSLWVDYFKSGSATVQSPMLLPIHPCNVCMWLLLISAFVKKREGTLYRLLTEFTFWAGTVCGTIGIVLNENFGNNPTLADYEVLKGMLSHSTMLFGAIYLLIGGFVKIRVFNVLSVISGLLLFVIDGAIINTLYLVFLDEKCNSMYLQEPPFADMPWLNTLVMGLLGVLVAFSISALYELIALPKEERWYSLLKKKYCERKDEKSVC